ncbi:hypothetical protein VaNZ11_016845 [Volvox africanus]|uniref:Mitochondrial inner membrane protease ATP23 n=1 Tax=Volvox africanus TaxID=51714 RepID=A0ABQ5SNL0_9CHLO|nr:hypothetical protein VaNZ11_016845 [Volvox africanus]
MGKISKVSGGGIGGYSKQETADRSGTKKVGSGIAAAASRGGNVTASGGGGGSYSLEIREGCVALMRFRRRDSMNVLLDPISNAMEGVIANRLGHNFALSDTAKDHVAFRKTCGLHKQVKYVIATLDGDAHSIHHEMCHARYYLDQSYKSTVMQVWSGALTSAQRDAVMSFLNRLKYDAVAHVDEFQAYLVTEKSNFFGMDLADAQQQLQASFPPGSWR